MIAVVLKGLAARKVRALMTAFAVVIGVAMVAGTFILTDTTEQSGYAVVDSTTATTDAAIFEKELIEGSTSGERATMPESLLAEVRALPGVAAATGEVAPQKETFVADILGRDGKRTAKMSAGRGVEPATAGQLAGTTAGAFGPLTLRSGEWPEGRGEVAIDRRTAAAQHYEIGDRVTVVTLGHPHTFAVAGIVSVLAEDLPPAPSVAVWDIPTAQTLFDREGRFDVLSIDAKPGVTGAQIVQAVKPLLPPDLQVRSNEASLAEAEGDWSATMSAIRAVLLAFGGIALLVGAFVIFNTLSITVAQRTRELATLRTLGASRKQVMRSVVLEGLVLGLVASIIGLVVGYGVARGMIVLVDSFVQLPQGPTIVASRTVIVSMTLGVVITLIASILPARRATRVPPIAAVREGARLPPTKLAKRSHRAGYVVVAGSLVVIALGALAASGGTTIGLLLGGGVLGLVAGIALLAPRLVKPLARVVGWPARRAGGVAGELAAANAVRNPGRTASTAAALMIGLTLVTVVAVLGAGLNSAARLAIIDQVHADYVVDGKEAIPFRARSGDKLAGLPGVTGASHVRSETVILHGKKTELSGLDPSTIERFYRFHWSSGSIRALEGDGAIVSETYAKAKHLALGSRLTVTTPSGRKGVLIVRGIHDPPTAEPLLGDVSIGLRTFDSVFANARNSFTFLDAAPRTAPAIRTAAAGAGDVRLHTGAAYADARTKDRETAMAMLYVLLGFSIVVSLFGMVNTMVLSVFERTREIGMLRTVGMTRRQARRMVRHESVITALIGAALGLALGLFLALVAIQALPDYATIAIPWQTLGGFTAVAVLAGMGAAILPARRTSRLNVLDALHYE